MTRIAFMSSPPLLAAWAALPAHAEDVTVGSLKISAPWARATPKGASVGGGYMKITNTGTAPDRLIGGSTDVASSFEVHEMKMEGGVMKMRPVAGGIEIKPGQTVDARPERLSRDVRRPEAAAQARRALQGDARIRQGRQGRCRLHGRGHRRQDAAAAITPCRAWAACR